MLIRIELKSNILPAAANLRTIKSNLANLTVEAVEDTDLSPRLGKLAPHINRPFGAASGGESTQRDWVDEVMSWGVEKDPMLNSIVAKVKRNLGPGDHAFS